MCISLKERRRGHGIGEANALNKRSTISTKNQMLEVIPEKGEKGDGGYVYLV